MNNSAQLEHEAEQARARLAQTLDELRDRITPGELVDQAVDYARDSGGGDFVRNLGRQMADNPLPVCLMGAGLTWLVLSNRRPARSDALDARRVGRVARDARGTQEEATQDARRRVGATTQSASDQLGGWAAEARDQAADAADATGQQIKETGNAVRSKFREGSQRGQAKIGEAAASLGESASSAYEATKTRAGAAVDAVGEATSDAYEHMADGASRAASRVTSSASTASQTVADASRRFLQMCTEEPLVLAGIGLAIGAVFGAAMPTTETEDRLMGKTSDRVKEGTREIAQEQLEKGKAVAAATLHEAREQAEKQGLGEVSEADSEKLAAAPTLVPSADRDGEAGKQKERPFAEPAHGVE